MRYSYYWRLFLTLFPIVGLLVFFRPGDACAFEFLWKTPALNMTLPEASRDVFVSARMEEWEITVSGDRFALQTPIIRPGFSGVDAESIEKVLVVFQPAGAVFSQASQIVDRAGVWLLRIEGVLSRGTTDGIVVRSVEVIYRDDSAELLPFEKEMSLGTMHARGDEDTAGGCNACFGLSVLALVGIFMLRPVRVKTANVRH